MMIEEAMPLLKKCVGVKFKDLFDDLPHDLRTNKGNVGQRLLIKIGLKLDSNLTDFTDGELKTNKSDENGNPLETMFITQISQQIDKLVGNKTQRFEESNLYKKIRRLVFLPVCKQAVESGDWYFVSVHNINLDYQDALRKQIESDYYEIANLLKNSIDNEDGDGFIHTANGKLIQIRSKDSKPYHKIYSENYKRVVADKNHAFYFKKEFMLLIRNNTYE